MHAAPSHSSSERGPVQHGVQALQRERHVGVHLARAQHPQRVQEPGLCEARGLRLVRLQPGQQVERAGRVIAMEQMKKDPVV